METSFNHDLNNDGVIGAPPASNQPLFAYQGTDANGAQLYDVTWNDQGSHPFAVRVLVPEHPSTNYAHSFLYALPVENGLTGQSLGDGLNELASLDVEDQYNATIIEPIFPMYSWYADNPNDATIDYETFVLVDPAPMGRQPFLHHWRREEPADRVLEVRIWRCRSFAQTS